jgi:hypothetical protein
VNEVSGVGESVVCAILPFPYLTISNRGVTSTAVLMSDESRFKETYEVGFVCRGSQCREGEVFA